MTYDGINTLYDKIKDNLSNFYFIDIGSGRGKLCLYMADNVLCLKSVGIELVTERHNDAQSLKDKLGEFTEIISKVEFINKSIEDVDLRDILDNNTAFIWISNLCLSPELTNKMFLKIKQEIIILKLN